MKYKERLQKPNSPVNLKDRLVTELADHAVCTYVEPNVPLKERNSATLKDRVPN